MSVNELHKYNLKNFLFTDTSKHNANFRLMQFWKWQKIK